jgi:hypothetical protein
MFSVTDVNRSNTEVILLGTDNRQELTLVMAIFCCPMMCCAYYVFLGKVIHVVLTTNYVPRIAAGFYMYYM